MSHKPAAAENGDNSSDIRRTGRPRKPNMRFADYDMDDTDTVNNVVNGVSISPEDVRSWQEERLQREEGGLTEEEMLQQALDISMEGGGTISSESKPPAAASAGTPESTSSGNPMDFSAMSEEEQIAYAMNISMQDCPQEAMDINRDAEVPKKENPKKGEKWNFTKSLLRKKAPPHDPEVHTLSSSEDSNDSLPDLQSRLQNNVQSTLIIQQSALTSHNSLIKSPIKSHTLSSDDEDENPGCQINKVSENMPVEDDEISIIEDYTQVNTSKGPLNIILDDSKVIDYYGSPTVSSKSSSHTSSGVRSSGWSTFDTRSIGSSSSFGDREMEKENFGIKRSINCLDEDDLPIIHDTSANFESNPISFNHKEKESSKNILPMPNKKANKKLRTEEIREEKAEKKRQREALKQQREAEKARLKAQKEAEKAASRAFKPGECMKYMIVNIDRRLLECVAGSQIITQLQTTELRYKVVDLPVHSSVTLVRVDPLNLSEQQEEEGIVVLDVEDFVTAVWQQVYGGATTGGLTHLYRDWVQKLQVKRLTLVVYDIETYLRGQKNTNNRQFRANVLGEAADGASKKGKKKKTQSASENTLKVSRIDVESALVTAQLECGLNHRLFGSPDKVGSFVAQLTKAVAEAPYKREKKESASFSWYAEASSVNTVKVDKSGVGLLKLWHQQLRQFNNVGVELAQAIAREYPSPQELIQAYQKCDTNAAAAMLLADILVRRSTGPLSSTRRIGPELSKRVHLFFTTANPDANLALK